MDGTWHTIGAQSLGNETNYLLCSCYVEVFCLALYFFPPKVASEFNQIHLYICPFQFSQSITYLDQVKYVLILSQVPDTKEKVEMVSIVFGILRLDRAGHRANADDFFWVETRLLLNPDVFMTFLLLKGEV